MIGDAIRSEDLFPLSGPMPSAQLIGRREWVGSVAAGVANGTNTAIPGGRKEGKTSACGGVVDKVASELGMLPIMVDLYEVDDENGFLTELQKATASALLPTPLGAIAPHARLLARLIGAGISQATLPPEAQALLDELPREHGRAEAVLSLPERAGRLHRKTVLLFIDEAQRMSHFSEGFSRTAHRAFRDSERVCLLLAGSEEGMMQQLGDDPLGPVSGLVAHCRTLDPIEDDEWHEGLGFLFGIGGCVIDDDAVEFIVQEAKRVGVSPVHSTIAIAHHTYVRAREEGRKVVTAGTAMQGFLLAEGDLRRIGRSA